MSVHAKALHRAAEILGGKEPLRTLLGVSARRLDAWMAGDEEPPIDIFLKAVDIISAGPARQLSPANDAVARSRQTRRASEVLRLATERMRQRSAEVLAAALAGRLASRVRNPLSALAFLNARFEPAQGHEMVEAALDAAVGATGADMGNVQLRCSEGLRIVAQRGFDDAFLGFFRLVTEGDDCACGRALRFGQRIVVPDVANDLIYAGTPAGDAMAKASARAVQSTPLLSVAGELLGVLSTHYERPHEPGDRELDIIDHIARRTAFWLDGGSL